MKQRWLVAIVGVPLLAAVLLLCPDWATLLLVCAIAGIAAYELLHTAGKKITRELYALVITVAVGQEVMLYLSHALAKPLAFDAIPAALWLPWLLVMCLFGMAVKAYGTEKAIPFADLGVSVFAGAVFPTLYSCIFLLRMQPDFGRAYVLVPFCIAFIGDSFSMYAGMLFGKRKMSPHVSPNKTWAGGIGGVVGGVLAMLLWGFISAKVCGYAPNYVWLALVGAAGNVFGQIGDLSMSLIKREAGIKDYSHLFLTHGGMLDRFDSTMFIAPVVYFFVAGGVM